MRIGCRQEGGVMLARFLTALVLASAVPAALAGRAVPDEAPHSQKPATAEAGKQAKAPKPWPPDAETLRSQRLSIEALPLFSGVEPVEITITADFKTVQRDRDADSKKTYPGTLSIVKDGAAGPPIPIQLRTRGHVRRNPRTCEFAPLRLEFPKDGVTDAVFSGLDFVRLGTHCQSEAAYQQYTLKEYLANRLLLTLTPRAQRTRLARVTYADTDAGKKPYTRFGIFFEDADDVASRMEAREEKVNRLMFGVLDQPSLLFMSLFQYMIGNTDYSILVRHNVMIFRDAANVRYAAPYDFDYSGLVYAHYAVPAKGLGLVSVRDRMYRGPCKTEAEVEEALEPFRQKQAELLALPASLPDFDEGHRRNTEKYLNEFFELAGKPDRVKKTFVTDCKPIVGM
jgi:hypothetical protein